LETDQGVLGNLTLELGITWLIRVTDKCRRLNEKRKKKGKDRWTRM
jgi:hypothetical protein